MGFLLGAFDESSDRDLSTFVVAGWIAQHSQWFEIERAWARRLKQEHDPMPMQYFAVKEWKPLKGEFLRFRDKAKYPPPLGRQAANEIRSDLISIIRSYPVVGFCVILPLKDYREVRKSSRARRILDRDPYVFAYSSAMVFFASRVAAMAHPEVVAFLIDSHSKAKTLSNSYEDLKYRNPGSSKWMGTLTDMSDKDSFALQAADLLAGSCKDLARRVILAENPDAAVAHFINEFGRSTGVMIWDKSSLKKLVRGNLLIDGRPGLYSSMQGNMLTELFSGQKEQ